MSEKEVELQYNYRVSKPSEINEHLQTLYNYSRDSSVIVECGVGTCISSWAFLHGLLNNNKPSKKLIQIDTDNNPKIQAFGDTCKSVNVGRVFYQDSSLKCPLYRADLVFIDTFHVYGQLKRELRRWQPYTDLFILHDTEVDKYIGEGVRMRLDIEKISQDLGWDIKDIIVGLKPAIDEFLQEHPEWKIEKIFTNNNGLTILRRHIDC